MKFLGTEYGGWLLDLELVPDNSTVISAGIGEDISFDTELIKRKNCQIVGIDPTIKSHKFIDSQTGLDNFSLIKKALDKTKDDIVFMYENTNPNYVSESILPNHHSVGNNYYLTETITLQELFEAHKNISVVKMDIEGSEFDIFKKLIKNKSRFFERVEFFHLEVHDLVEDFEKQESEIKDYLDTFPNLTTFFLR